MGSVNNVKPVPDTDLAQLVTSARAGSSDALAELYVNFAAPVMALAYRLTGSTHDAEDVLHDVFLGLPEALRRYDERGSLDGWIKRVAARVALTRLRAAARRREVPLDAGPEPARDAEARMLDDRAALERAIARLPDSLRVVFVLKDVEGYSHAEIAALLGISRAASEVRLFRAVRRLRDTLT